MKHAIFLDRDGVLLENRPDYVRRWDEAEFYPGVLEALAKASRSSYKFVIVTNQSGVGRGLVDAEEAEAINRRLVIEVHKAGGRIDAVCMCIHAPEQECDCRKPKPGLLLHATRLLGLDLANSVMIGDAITDLEAGEAAGVGQVAMVRTGRGEEQLRMNGEVIQTYEDLPEALAALI
ncbi:MAG: D-glycero-alpha-D-manno-heptose-1,7-bisphosphate 7-phosphatase [Anaerolineales bacterium]